MLVKDICTKLNITNATLKAWIDEFSEYFSEGAKAYRRQFEQNDLDMLATIATLSQDGIKYDVIRKRLAAGYREDFESVTIGVDNRVIPVSTAQATIDASKINAQMEIIKAERDRLAEMLETEQQAHRDTREHLEEKIDTLNNEIKNLHREIGRLEGRLDRDE